MSVTSSESAGTPGKAPRFAAFARFLTRLRAWLTRSTAKPWNWVALAVLVPVMAGVAQTGAGQSLLRSAGLAAPPTSYVALSFRDPQALPARLASPVAAVRVSFVIRSVSASPAARVFHWSIQLREAGSRLTVAAGQVPVPGGAERIVSTTVLAACSGGRLQLAVKLARPAESIDYWTACAASQGIIR